LDFNSCGKGRKSTYPHQHKPRGWVGCIAIQHERPDKSIASPSGAVPVAAAPAAETLALAAAVTPASAAAKAQSPQAFDGAPDDHHRLSAVTVVATDGNK
jgi:hypothetical protein